MGEDRPQPALERVQVHLRGRDRGRAPRRRRRRASSWSSATPAPASRPSELPRLSSASTASPARRRARTRAPGSAWRWCRSWSGCTAATSRSTSELGAGHDLHGRHPARVGPPAGRAHRRGAGAPRSTAVGAAPFVEEALRWLPSAATSRRSRRRAGPTARTPTRPARGGRARSCSPTTTPTCATTSAGCCASRLRGRGGRRRRGGAGAPRATPPDLVLSDVMMPRLDGFALLRALRADPRTRDVPVVLLSARAGEEARGRGARRRRRRLPGQAVLGAELVARVGTHLALAGSAAEAARLLAQAPRRDRGRARRLADLIANAPAFIAAAARARARLRARQRPLPRLVGPPRPDRPADPARRCPSWPGRASSTCSTVSTRAASRSSGRRDAGLARPARGRHARRGDGRLRLPADPRPQRADRGHPGARSRSDGAGARPPAGRGARGRKRPPLRRGGGGPAGARPVPVDCQPRAAHAGHGDPRVRADDRAQPTARRSRRRAARPRNRHDPGRRRAPGRAHPGPARRVAHPGRAPRAAVSAARPAGRGRRRRPSAARRPGRPGKPSGPSSRSATASWSRIGPASTRSSRTCSTTR